MLCPVGERVGEAHAPDAVARAHVFGIPGPPHWAP